MILKYFGISNLSLEIFTNRMNASNKWCVCFDESMHDCVCVCVCVCVSVCVSAHSCYIQIDKLLLTKL